MPGQGDRRRSRSGRRDVRHRDDGRRDDRRERRVRERLGACRRSAGRGRRTANRDHGRMTMRRSFIATLLTTLACGSAFGATDAGALEYAHHVGVGSGGNYFGPFVSAVRLGNDRLWERHRLRGYPRRVGSRLRVRTRRARDGRAGHAGQLRTVHPQPFDVHQLLQRLLLLVGRRSSRRAGARRSSARACAAAAAVPGAHRAGAAGSRYRRERGLRSSRPSSISVSA